LVRIGAYSQNLQYGKKRGPKDKDGKKKGPRWSNSSPAGVLLTKLVNNDSIYD